MSTTVVTGANGHIGICLVRRLLELGRTVRVVDLEAGPWLRELDVEICLGDIRDEAFMRAHLGQGDVLYHLASLISVSGDRKGRLRSINVEGARVVAGAALAQGVRRMVHFSSVYAFDLMTRGAPVSESTRLVTEAGSKAAYNCSKALGQQAVLALVPQGLDVVVVNPSGVIGPYDYKLSLQGAAIRETMRGRTWHPPGGFNWVDVRDVVEGALQAEARGRTGECYILGHPDHTTHLDLARMARELTGVPRTDRVIPMPLLRALATALAGVERLTGAEQVLTHEALDSLTSNPDVSIARAVRELGYQVRPIERSVRDIHAWYVQTGQLPTPGEPGSAPRRLPDARRDAQNRPPEEPAVVQHELTIDVARPIPEVYAFLADLTKMPGWLTRCVEVKRLSPDTALLRTGDRLVYTYRERSRTATLEGTVEAAEPDHRIDLRFEDRTMRIRVGFELSPDGDGTRVRHFVEIEPLVFVLKLIKPLIRRGVAKDTAEDAAKLKRLLESPA